MNSPAVSLGEQIACVSREIRMRENVYPRWIANKRMSESQAAKEMNAMRAVLATLERLDRDQNPGLFG